MSGLSGFSTQKKVLGKIPGYTDEETQDKSNFATLQNLGSDMFGLDTVMRSCFQVSSGNTITSSTERILTHSVLSAKKGDLIHFTSGALNGLFFPILTAKSTTVSILANILETQPTAGDTFEILRFTIFRTDSDGNISVSVTPSPLTFTLNGSDQEVVEDTTDSANDIPLPTTNFGPKIVDGDVYNAAIINTNDITLFTAALKIRKAKLVNNSGTNFYIKNTGAIIGCLSKGESFEFDLDMNNGDTLDISAIDSGSGVNVAAYSIVWNVFA